MSNERQPLLTEEQIQELSEVKPYLLRAHFEHTYPKLYYRCVDGYVHISFENETFLAFLRGKTRRVLNIDRLRKDVKAWVDDPNRKYPEWMLEYDPVIHSTKAEDEQWILADCGNSYYDPDYPQFFASIIGINPDDYFEEVEVTE